MSYLKYSGKFKKHFMGHIFHLINDQNLSYLQIVRSFPFLQIFAIKNTPPSQLLFISLCPLGYFFRINSKVLYLFLDYGYKLQGCLLEWFCLFTFPPAVHLLFQIFTTLKDKYL